MPTLGGSLFVADGLKYDYCFCEAINSLAAVCDQVAVIFFNPEDYAKCMEQCQIPVHCGLAFSLKPYADWDNNSNQERLSYWTNKARDMLSTDWQFNLQADEVIHESSFPFIRQAIESQTDNGFRVRRLNLWRDPCHYLDVPDGRKPVSDYVCRLARTSCDSYGDGESLTIPGGANVAYEDSILIYHMGFVRDPKVHIAKINNMGKIFGWGDEPKLRGLAEFDPYKFFGDNDLKPIPQPLPKFVEQWAAQRYPRAS